MTAAQTVTTSAIPASAQSIILAVMLNKVRSDSSAMV